MRNYANLTITLPRELYNWLMGYKKRHYVSLSALITGLLGDWKEKKSDEIN